MGYSPWGPKESDRTEQLSLIHIHMMNIYMFVSIMVYRRILNVALCAERWDLVVYPFHTQ